MDSQYENLSEQYSAKPQDYYETPRSEMLPYVPLGSKMILEVGCGGGSFGKLIKETLPEVIVWGIEPGEAAAAMAAKSLDKVLTGTFSPEMPELQGRLFDTICLNDVLEHLVKPETMLRELKQFLAPNGTVVASIPNILAFYQITQILIKQDWKYEEFGIMDNTHLRFYTKKSMIRMFEECGYRIELIEGINSCVGIKYIVANTLLLGGLKDWKYSQFAIQAKAAK